MNAPTSGGLAPAKYPQAFRHSYFAVAFLDHSTQISDIVMLADFISSLSNRRTNQRNKLNLDMLVGFTDNMGEL